LPRARSRAHLRATTSKTQRRHLPRVANLCDSVQAKSSCDSPGGPNPLPLHCRHTVSTSTT
jgi:hypothetical protein